MTVQIRVVIIDSDPLIAESLALSLRQQPSFEAYACTSYEDAATCVAQHNPSIILVNIHDATSADTLQMCEQLAVLQQNPIVLLASRTIVEGEAFLADAVEIGAEGV